LIFLPRRVETDRLVLRRYRRADLQHLPPLIGDWEVARWLARSPYPYTDKDARDWLRLSRRIWWTRKGLPYAVTRAEDGKLLGGIGVSFDDGEVGYWLSRDIWGQGYGTEAVAAITGLALGRLGMDSVWAAVMPENAASRGVLAKVGYKFDGIHPYRMRDGEMEAYYYRLHRVDWSAAHG